MKNLDPLKLYTDMLRIRFVEETISQEYSKQEMRCPVHLSIGQEAIPVGVSSRLTISDQIVSAHRSHAHYLAKGCDLKKMISELFGKVDGCCRGKGGSMHLFDLEGGQIAAVPIVGSSIPIGTGVALGLKRQKKPGIVVIYLGEGATEEGVFSESLDFAKLQNLPVLFVCENNLYSVYTPLGSRQDSKRSIIDIAKAHGISAISGDGNDVIEVQKLTSNAIIEINTHSTPFLLELSTYRWLEHCGPNFDDHLKYRQDGELSNWMERCPIKKLKLHLEKNHLINNRIENKIIEKIKLEISEAFEHARKSSFPDPTELFLHVYAPREIE
ncbi:MAG: thiamine pyrophosphate-dependent dehydrogenase E1 component subunit alpha [Alphaproteobacteria bacterium]|nr:thiamine pyrophosphate-dependent dehydrogenase E1 component subunit alpha [Alphaproteobacteria bacterium]